MKRFAIFLLLILSFSVATFAQTKVNSGKNFVTYSYDNLDKAAEDFGNMCSEYGFEYLYLWDNIDFSNQNCFAINSGKWDFYIIRWVNGGLKGSIFISSPEGRQVEIAGNSHNRVYSITGSSSYVDYKCNHKDFTDALKLRYSFLGEPIP